MLEEIISQENKNSNLKYLVSLSHFPKFGPVRMRKLSKFFTSPKEAFYAEANKLKQAGLEENVAMEFVSARNKINPDEIMEKMNEENIKVAVVKNNDYPKLLKEIYNPPHIIYYKGELPIDGEFNIGVVGARKFSPYGQMVVEEIVGGLARNYLTIVSGLALGIDALAHNAALAVGGKTISVIGSGLDKQSIYPSSNRYLADKIIASGGGIISEFPIGTPPLKHNFPLRNRIISGLSLGTLIIEAGSKSGALITAQYALEQNREIFAVPGSIFSPVSAGANDLLKKGARVVTCAEDILETLDLMQVAAYIDNKKIMPETPMEEKIFNLLSKTPTHINELIRLSKLDTNVINSTLVIMEMKGMIKNLGNMQYVLAR